MVVQQVPVRGDPYYKKHSKIDQEIVGVAIDRAVKGKMHKTRQLVSESERVIEG
jgi:hypothetical protein